MRPSTAPNARSPRPPVGTMAILSGVVCPYSPCPVVIGDVLAWRNRDHITATFAAQLAPSMRRRHRGGALGGWRPLRESLPTSPSRTGVRETRLEGHQHGLPVDPVAVAMPEDDGVVAARERHHESVVARIDAPDRRRAERPCHPYRAIVSVIRRSRRARDIARTAVRPGYSERDARGRVRRPPARPSERLPCSTRRYSSSSPTCVLTNA